MSDGLETLTPLSAIRTALVDALGDLLGTYTFSSGQPTPAIRADDGSDPYPEEPRVQGLEVVIQRAREISLTPQLANCWEQRVSTLIVLKQWDIQRNTLEEFNLCWRAIASLGLQPSQPVRTTRNTVLDNIETMRFSYTESVVIGL